MQTPYFIKLPACTRKHLNINITNTGKGNERIPPDGFDMAALENYCPRASLQGDVRYCLNAVSHPSGCFLILSLRRGYFCGVGAVFRIRISFRSPAVGRV